jgi:hypothetical protein
MEDQPTPSRSLPLLATVFLIPPAYAWSAFLLGRAGRPALVDAIKALPDLVQIGIILGCPVLAAALALAALLWTAPGRREALMSKGVIAAGGVLAAMAAVSIAV